jgi:8-oxo-dGTP pyrophosphatase MutT (NUDIX family)
MRFLPGYYAFPGGKVDPADAEPALLGRCHGLTPDRAAALIPPADGLPPVAYWVAAARELLEETGVLPVVDEAGGPVTMRDGDARRLAAVRRRLMAAEAPLADLLRAAGWLLDLGAMRYLSHFITPPPSPIRFSARFFLAPLPPGQAPSLYTEETSEAFWIPAAEGVRGWESGRMPMAEPAEAGLRYLAAFDSLDALWAAHADGRHKIHGIADRLVAAGFAVPRGRPRA